MKPLAFIFSVLLTSVSFNAMASEHPAWSYNSAGSPEHWGDLSPDFSQCKDGVNQSPVNIASTIKANLRPLNMQFRPVSLMEINNGHTVQIASKDGDMLTLDDEKFILQQFHFHAPGENTIKGVRYPLEAHFVHQNRAGEIAVVAVMFKRGAENKELNKLWQQLPDKQGAETVVAQSIDLKKLFPAKMNYYRFSGSLTTPPCTEGVRWIVMKQPVTASEQQIQQFAAVMHHANNRPVQPAHGRMVLE